MGILSFFRKTKVKKNIKYNKDIFIYNVQYMIIYGDEPEIYLYDQSGRQYFVIAYQNFVDYYDANHNYKRLNSIDNLFEYINIDDIVEISDGSIDYSKDVKEQSIIIDNKIWYNA